MCIYNVSIYYIYVCVCIAWDPSEFVGAKLVVKIPNLTNRNGDLMGCNGDIIGIRI